MPKIAVTDTESRMGYRVSILAKADAFPSDQRPLEMNLLVFLRY